MHTSETLTHLGNALQRFHDNKAIFVALGVREEFNLPKLHACRHYVMYIKLFGTTDNYNTEYTERLHIDLAKDAYCSTNFKDEGAAENFQIFSNFAQIGCPELKSWPFALRVRPFDSRCTFGGPGVFQSFMCTPRQFVRSDFGVFGCWGAEHVLYPQ
jgi:hypothetical protein